jgi:uncharacterized protein YkwD
MKMQLKALAAIVSIALTVGVHAVPNPVDQAAGVNDVLKRSHSHGIDISKRQDLSSVAQEWLRAINFVRAKRGPTLPPFTWDFKLAAFADAWIGECKYRHNGSPFQLSALSDPRGVGLTPSMTVKAWKGGYSLANSPQ